MAENGTPSQILTVSCAFQEDRLIAVFGLKATLHDNASTVVPRLVERGTALSILSGDEIGAVQKVALKLGISHKACRARCTAQEKQQYIKEIVQGGNNTVLFWGDGVNDSAALSQASDGVHINSRTGTACIAGDAVLIRLSLLGILVLISLSRNLDLQSCLGRWLERTCHIVGCQRLCLYTFASYVCWAGRGCECLVLDYLPTIVSMVEM